LELKTDLTCLLEIELMLFANGAECRHFVSGFILDWCLWLIGVIYRHSEGLELFWGGASDGLDRIVTKREWQANATTVPHGFFLI